MYSHVRVQVGYMYVRTCMLIIFALRVVISGVVCQRRINGAHHLSLKHVYHRGSNLCPFTTILYVYNTYHIVYLPKQLVDLCDDARYNKLRKCPDGYLCTFFHSLRAGLEASDETGKTAVHVGSVGQKLGVNQPRVHRVARDTSS